MSIDLTIWNVRLFVVLIPHQLSLIKHLEKFEIRSQNKADVKNSQNYKSADFFLCSLTLGIKRS